MKNKNNCLMSGLTNFFWINEFNLFWIWIRDYVLRLWLIQFSAGRSRIVSIFNKKLHSFFVSCFIFIDTLNRNLVFRQNKCIWTNSYKSIRFADPAAFTQSPVLTHHKHILMRKFIQLNSWIKPITIKYLSAVWSHNTFCSICFNEFSWRNFFDVKDAASHMSHFVDF